jgi:hypothetical protein
LVSEMEYGTLSEFPFNESSFVVHCSAITFSLV